MKKKSGMSRRKFMKDSSLAALAGSLFFTDSFRKGVQKINDTDSPKLSDSKFKTKVVLVRDKDLLDRAGKPRYEVVLGMLDTAVTTLMGKKDPVECWKRLIKKDDIVGVKSNVWRYLPTTEQMEKALKKRVMDAGVSENKVGVGDRGILKDNIFKNATALINARPMRSHHWSGVGSLIKNYIMFVSRPWEYHGDSCADLASIWNLPLVKNKTRLNILVMFTPQFHGIGPHNFNPKYVWKYYGMIVGFDPVAIDSTGIRILQAKRKSFFNEDRPINPPPKHVLLADTRYHLGTADPQKIKIIKIGYKEDMLI